MPTTKQQAIRLLKNGKLNRCYVLYKGSMWRISHVDSGVFTVSDNIYCRTYNSSDVESIIISSTQVMIETVTE